MKIVPFLNQFFECEPTCGTEFEMPLTDGKSLKVPPKAGAKSVSDEPFTQESFSKITIHIPPPGPSINVPK